MTITLPESLYRRIAAQARVKTLTPVDFLTDFLDTPLAPQHPPVERIHGSGGWRAVVKGTRTGVDTGVGYRRAGYTPEEIAEDLLPQPDLAQVYDALSYYEDYREEMDEYAANNTPEVWRTRVIEELWEEQAKALLGEQ